jgi:hypothetical protein
MLPRAQPKENDNATASVMPRRPNDVTAINSGKSTIFASRESATHDKIDGGRVVVSPTVGGIVRNPRAMASRQ